MKIPENLKKSTLNGTNNFLDQSFVLTEDLLQFFNPKELQTLSTASSGDSICLATVSEIARARNDLFNPFFVLLADCSLRVDFDSLLENPKFSDVVLVSCDKREFPAHRCVLVAQSSVFSAMFDHDMTESQSGVVNIDDMDGEILSGFLNYMYTGRFNYMEPTIVQQLMMAADKYSIELLKSKCEVMLVEQLNGDNLVDVLLCADACGTEFLKEKAVEFIKEHEEVVQSSKFRDIELSHPKLTIEILRQMLNL